VSIVKSRFFLGIPGTSAPVRGGRRPFGFLASNRGRRRDGPRTSSGGVSPPRRAASRVEGPRASSRLGRRWFSLSRRGAPVGAPRRAQLRGRTVELGGPPRSRSEGRPFGFCSGFRDPRPDRRFGRPERGPRTDVGLRQ